MSLEYGLGATVNAASEMLNIFRKKRLIDGRPIFTRLIFREKSGNILFESSDDAKFKGDRQRPDNSVGRAGSNSGFSIGKIGKEEYLIISLPFLFKGREMGSISGWIPVELVHRHFIDTDGGRDSWTSIIVFENKFLFGDHDPAYFFPDGSQPDPSGMNPGVIKTYSTSSPEKSRQFYQAFVTLVDRSAINI
jgi:hypothetical protein